MVEVQEGISTKATTLQLVVDSLQKSMNVATSKTFVSTVVNQDMVTMTVPVILAIRTLITTTTILDSQTTIIITIIQTVAQTTLTTTCPTCVKATHKATTKVPLDVPHSHCHTP